MAAINFEKAFDAYVAAHQKTWQHDRSKSVGASEAFGCLRKSWFGKHAAPKDPDYKDSWGAMERGNVIENAFVAPAMEWFMENQTKDAVLLWAGDKQRTLIQGKLSATPDGLVVYADDDALAEYGIPSLGGTECFNLEIKSIDPRVNLKEEKAIHRGQTIVQMGLTRATTKWKPNYAVIIYVDASFFDDIEIFVVPFDQKTFDVAVDRAKAVFDVKDPSDIYPEGKIDGACEYCPYKRECARVSKQSTPTDGEANSQDTPLPIMEEFERLVRAERVASSAKKAATTEHAEASERLKQWFRETGVRRAAIDGFRASISWIKGRKTLDVQSLRDAGVPVDDHMKEGEGHDRLNISEKGSTKADED